MIAAVDPGRAVLVVAVLVLVVLPALLVALVVAADRVTGWQVRRQCERAARDHPAGWEGKP